MLFFRIAAQLAFCGACLLCGVVALGADYVVVVSKATQSDSEWSKVVEELIAKHQAEVVVYDKHISESLPVLRKTFPRYACFVATSEEASRQRVADVHRLTRTLDDNPYADVFWGILTGYDAANALAIAKEREPLVVRRVASGTELAMSAQRDTRCTLSSCRYSPETGHRDRPTGPLAFEGSPQDVCGLGSSKVTAEQLDKLTRSESRAQPTTADLSDVSLKILATLNSGSSTRTFSEMHAAHPGVL